MLGLSVLIIEPFYGGSHRQLVDLIVNEFGEDVCDTITLPAKKWHWRARTSALFFSQVIDHKESYRSLLCSSTLNLAELVALRPDLAKLKKIIYFHENQLVYPVRKQQERDFQYGYNQILSSLVADHILFNSKFNMESFLSGIRGHLKLIPDNRPKNLDESIRPKCGVVYFPLKFDAQLIHQADETNLSTADSGVELPAPHSPKCSRLESPAVTHAHSKDAEAALMVTAMSRRLHIVWPHRWEHDKNPDLFFKALFRLKEEGLNFCVSVLGEQFTDVPDIFEEAKQKLEGHIVSWGYAESKEKYYDTLRDADVVVSTADHEFFGVAMMEAVNQGCYPVCPNKLVYPELFPEECLYNTDNQLFKKLKNMCKHPGKVKRGNEMIDLRRFSWDVLKESFRKVIMDSS